MTQVLPQTKSDAGGEQHDHRACRGQPATHAFRPGDHRRREAILVRPHGGAASAGPPMQRARSSRRAASAAASVDGVSVRVAGFQVVAEYMLPVSLAGPAPGVEVIGKSVRAMLIAAVPPPTASQSLRYS